MTQAENTAVRGIAAAIAGAILLLIALLLIGFTEHSDRLRVMGEDALGGFVLTGNQAKPGAASDGQLVFVSGDTQIAKPALDPQFNVSANAAALVRKIEMFQWHETDGGRRSYDQDWVDHPVDASKFAQPAGHENPGAFPFDGARFDSPDVRVGGFRLGPKLVAEIEGVEDFTPDFRALPPNMAATFQAHDGALVTSADPQHPRIGDLRVSWMQIAPKELTVLARAQGGVLRQTQDASGRDLTQVQIGKRSLSDVVPDAAPRPNYAWAKRALAILLAWAGVLLILPRGKRDEWLALAAGIAPLALLASLFWFGVRNFAAIVLLALAILAAVAAAWRARSMKFRLRRQVQ
ncbi:MAG TPA: TMEM43 family protein [Rhodanobacteraceae bacterium]|nr:TMEM43 family protein [Rhodanobacteraceae bacterium]